MACKFCDKKVYYDTTWYHSDGGYGDDDYGGIDVNQIAVRICPNCGEMIRPHRVCPKCGFSAFDVALAINFIFKFV